MTETTLVKKILGQLKPLLPQQVKNLHFETGEDATGDPAVWIWVEIPDDAPEEVWSWESRSKMRELIRTAFKSSQLEDWVYIRFRELAPEWLPVANQWAVAG